MVMLCFCGWGGRTAGSKSTLFQEEDGDPSARFKIIKFSNGSITNNGDGSGSISTTGGATTDKGEWIQPTNIGDSLSIDGCLTVRETNFVVDNDDSDKQTRLFLFDYIYGVSNESEGSAEGIADRDLRSYSLREDLVYQYSPLLTRNNSNLLTIKDSNTNMSFPVPGTHPYFNIFSK